MYDSVKRRAADTKTVRGKQKLIKELYADANLATIISRPGMLFALRHDEGAFIALRRDRFC